MTLFFRKLLRFICSLILATLSLLVLWGVLTRYVVGEQSIFTDELAQALLVVLSFFGGALAFSEKSHVGLDLLANYFSPEAKITVHFITNILTFIFIFLVMCIGGGYLVASTHAAKYYLTTIHLAWWVVYLSMPISGFFVLYFTSINILDLIKGDKK